MNINSTFNAVSVFVIVVFLCMEACTSTSQMTPSIDLWHIQGVGEGPAIVEDAVDRFQEDHPNVEVTVKLHLNDPYKFEIRKMLEVGTAPCIFPTWGGGVLHEYIKRDYILDLTDMIEADDYNKRFMSRAFDNVNYQERIWGVPVENTTAAVVFYNKDIFDTYGLTPPETYDELLFVINTLNNAGIAPFALANKTMWPGSIHYILLVDRLGGSETFRNTVRRQNGSFNNPVFIEAGRLLQDLVRQNAFNAGFNNLNHDAGESRALLYSETAAMEIMGSWNIPLIKAENPQYFENKLDLFLYPQITMGQGNLRSIIGTVGDQYYHISKTCRYPELAFEMIQYLIDDVAIEKRSISFGSIPPISGFNPMDPISKKVLEYIETASDVYLWYDQELPFELGETHKNIVYKLLDLTITPEEAAQAMEEASVNYLSE